MGAFSGRQCLLGMGEMMRGARITAIFLVAMGVLVLSVSAVVAWRTRAFEQRSVLAQGTVISVEDAAHGEVRVKGPGAVDFTYSQTGFAGPLSLGRILPVRYDPADPAGTARAGDPEALYGFPKQFALLGVLMIVAAVLGPLLVRRFPALFAFAVRP